MAQSIEKMSNQQIPHSIDTIVSNENTCKPSKHALNKANMLTDKHFSSIQRQFLCCVPVKKIQWEVKSKKNEKIQFFLIQIKIFRYQSQEFFIPKHKTSRKCSAILNGMNKSGYLMKLQP